MDDPGIAGTNFDASHVQRRRTRDRNREVAEHIGAAGRNDKRLRDLNHEVWRAELPAVAPRWTWREIVGVTARRAVFDPLLNRRDFFRLQATFVEERSIAWLRQPRRHDAIRRHRRDLPRTA